MKKTLWIFSGLLVLVASAAATEKVTYVLNLENGYAHQKHSILGVAYKEFSKINNPRLCPKWEKPEAVKNQNSLSKSCFKHLSNTKNCIAQTVIYQDIYEQGCST